jgi:hypothetical protein
MKKSRLVKVTSNIFGTALQFNLIVTAVVVGGIAAVVGRKRTGKAIWKTGIRLGRFTGKAIRASGELASIVMEATSKEGARLSKTVGDRMIQSRVRIYGDAREFFDKEKVIEIKNEQFNEE